MDRVHLARGEVLVVHEPLAKKVALVLAGVCNVRGPSALVWLGAVEGGPTASFLNRWLVCPSCATC